MVWPHLAAPSLALRASPAVGGRGVGLKARAPIGWTYARRVRRSPQQFNTARCHALASGPQGGCGADRAGAAALAPGGPGADDVAAPRLAVLHLEPQPRRVVLRRRRTASRGAQSSCGWYRDGEGMLCTLQRAWGCCRCCQNKERRGVGPARSSPLDCWESGGRARGVSAAPGERLSGSRRGRQSPRRRGALATAARRRPARDAPPASPAGGRRRGSGKRPSRRRCHRSSSRRAAAASAPPAAPSHGP